MRLGFSLRAALPFVLLAVSGCADLLNVNASSVRAAHPSLAPATQPTASLTVDASQIKPMYDRRMLAVDLPTVVRVAMARNIDIQEAQQRIAAARGEFEANIGMILPVSHTEYHRSGHPRSRINAGWLRSSSLQPRYSSRSDTVDH